ncbi:MAG: hypothetical protein GC205_10635 [Bacteroidetes bacterium]|nr:hypothetical protein [Bacteroidota bacterium]
MKTIKLLCTTLIVAGTGLLAQAQTAEPAQTAAPAANSSIQVYANQGNRLGGETQQVSLPPESGRLMLGNWQMMKMTDETGTILTQQKPEDRDRFQFQEGSTVSVIKKGYAAEGYWKFSPASGQLVISDQSRSQQVSYTVLQVSAEELVLYFADESKGNKVLYFAPVP